MRAYVWVFGLLLAAGFGAPVPEELPVAIAGALVGHAAQAPVPEHPVWYVMLPVCIAGVVVSDGVLYGIGRLWGPRLLDRPWVRSRLLPPDRRARIEENFHRRGVRILLAARFLPGIRTPIFLMAGVLRVPLGQFLLADGLYAVPGVTLLFGLAYLFTDQFVELVRQLDSVRPLVVVLLIAAAAGWLAATWLRRGPVTGREADPPPA
jgi:membrane protein DedA with SNARE-associated domain